MSAAILAFAALTAFACYRKAAVAFAQTQAEEERIAARWVKQYGGWTKAPNPCRSATNLAAYYRQLAADALAHTAEQHELARS